ncbi:transposase domain-containing protein [Pseudonocardia sp. Cha107L01]|uniref:transposase domain-containing protein n=1 Tax=Pseudonocardia sp. Cha107L01 TaxID=3457576 RepID=UPI00403EEC76
MTTYKSEAQQRLRSLPSRTGVYFVLALALFPRIGYARVWAKLCAGLVALAGGGLVVPAVSEKALRELRRRLGPAPFKALFEVVAGPLAQPRTPGVCFAGMRTVAFDGINSLKIPDTDRNRRWIGRIWYRLAFAGYPTLRLMCLVETGTRGLLGGAIGTPGDRDESHLARRLLASAASGHTAAGRPGVRLHRVPHRGQPDRGQAADPRRHQPQTRGPAPAARWLLPVPAGRASRADHRGRADGARRDGNALHDHYRLITTLLDDRQFPAEALIQLYHERWEIETAYLALRHTMLAGHVLRSQDRAGVEQEVWALLTLYQLLRTAMVEAIETRPGLDPDRASFTSALQAARDQLITAGGIDPDPTSGVADRLGVIGQAVLATLLPARRARYSNRNVKCTTSRYHARNDGRPTLSTDIVAMEIAVHTPPPQPTPSPQHPFRHRPPRAASKPTTPPAPTRRQLVTAILLSEPCRDWRGFELAEKLQVNKHNMLTQLAEWARLGFIRRTGAGTYASRPHPLITSLASSPPALPGLFPISLTLV